MKLEAHLRALAAFARQRSFSAAAAELRVSQPAISKHVAELERALGLKLVERARQDGALTKTGDFVANHVLRAEFLLVQAGLAAAQFRKSGSGLVAVVAWSLTGRNLFLEIIAEFQHSHPGVRVTLQVGTAEQAVELLQSHRGELGFVAGAAGLNGVLGRAHSSHWSVGAFIAPSIFGVIVVPAPPSRSSASCFGATDELAARRPHRRLQVP